MQGVGSRARRARGGRPAHPHLCTPVDRLWALVQEALGPDQSRRFARSLQPVDGALAEAVNAVAQAGSAVFERCAWLRGKRASPGVTELGDVAAWVQQMRFVVCLPPAWSAFFEALFDERGHYACGPDAAGRPRVPDLPWLLARAEEAARAAVRDPVGSLLGGDAQGVQSITGYFVTRCYLAVGSLDLPRELPLLRRIAEVHTALCPDRSTERRQLASLVAACGRDALRQDLARAAREAEPECGLPLGTGSHAFGGAGCLVCVAGLALGAALVAAGALG